MRIKEIRQGEHEIIVTTEDYFPEYMREPNGRWLRKLPDGWVELGMLEDYEKEYRRFKHERELADRKARDKASP